LRGKGEVIFLGFVDVGEAEFVGDVDCSVKPSFSKAGPQTLSYTLIGQSERRIIASAAIWSLDQE